MCEKGLFVIVAVAVFILLTLRSLFAENRFIKEKVSFKESTEFHFVKAAWKDDTTAVVKFTDRIIDQEDALDYCDQFHVFIRKLGQRQTNIVLSVTKAKMEPLHLALSTIFLKTVAGENGIRERKRLQPISVFLHVPIKSIHDENSLQDINFLAVGVVNYIENGGNISGVIFEPSLVLNPSLAGAGVYGKQINKALVPSVVEFKKLLKKIKLRFGYELKIGLALDSYMECITGLVSEVSDIMSSIDVVIVGASIMDYNPITAPINEKHEEFFYDCVDYFKKQFPKLVFYHIGEFFDLKN